DLIQERLDIPAITFLDATGLKRIVMPNRVWVFEFLGRSTIAMSSHQGTGPGMLTVGDPVVQQYGPGASPGSYSAWNSNLVTYFLPGDDASPAPMVVLLWSNGTSSSNHYGYVSKMLALSTSGRWLYATGLDGDGPTGCQGEGGALDAYRAFAADT